MSPEKEAALVAKYPQIFADYRDGFECDDGWFDLIDRLCADVMATDHGPNFKATQVKEKFGGLRFYATSAPDVIWQRINDAEAESYRTCESCGTKDNVSTEGPGWIKTLCDSCRATRRAKQMKKAAGSA